MKSFLRSKLVPALVLALASTSLAYAQDTPPDAPGTDPLDPTPPPATAIPIDGGASLLLAGGVAYGLKKLRARRRSA